MRRWKISWITVMVLVLAAASIAAQTPQEGFVPVTEAQAESLPASPLIYTAYAFVWLMLIAYVFLLWRRVGRVEKEIADVTAKLSGRR